MCRSGFGRVVALAGLLSVLLSCPGEAEAEAGNSPYKVHWVADLSITGAAVATWIVPSLFVKDLVTPSCPCTAASLNSLDRGTAGVDRVGSGVASNVALYVLLPLAYGLDALDVRVGDENWMGWLVDSVVMVQALAINGALTTVVKVAAGRPRPFLYGRAAGDPALRDSQNYTSFFSGHTSTAFAVGLSYAQTFAYRHPDSPYRFLVYAAAIAIGGTVGTFRVLAGKHFPSDVLVGAGAGTLLGLGIPWLHHRQPETAVTAAPIPSGAMLVVTHVFL